MTEIIDPTASPPEQLDAEHRVQLELLRALDAAIQGPHDAASLDAILDQYISYSELHFMSEQLVMRLYAYPDYDDHVRRHEDLIERMRRMRAYRDAGDDQGLAAAAAEQKAQLLGHIRASDRNFDTFLHELAHGLE